MPTILTEIKKNYSRIFRRLSIKRKSSSTGLFESSWVDISRDVQTWGRVRKETDPVHYSKIRFADVLVKMDNISGRYNPNDDDASLWNGYGSQQRTLVKIEAGFIHQTQSAGGVWTNTEYPTTSAVFHGIVSGNIDISDRSEIVLPIKPVLQVFRDYPARNLTGFTSTGLTASQFMGIVRDQTDGSGGFIFRPFFNDTTTYWDISTTTNVYANLNTSVADDVRDRTVWDIMEKLSEAENMVTWVDRTGVFKFTSRANPTTTSQFTFNGVGFLDREYGHTIKNISKFGKKHTDFYTRVQVKFIDLDTITSFRVRESSFTVTGSNDPWQVGHRTFSFENFWIPNTATADTILNTIFTNVNSLKDRIEFKASFVPHIEILDLITLNYDSSEQGQNSRWDLFDWAADDTSVANDLYWDKYAGNAIRLNGREFKILSIDIDLDRLETGITAIQS